MTFKAGEAVRWYYLIQGVLKERVGEVVEVVSAGQVPKHLQSCGQAQKTSTPRTRNQISYVIRAKHGKTTFKNYWPRTDALSRVYPAVPPHVPSLTLRELRLALQVIEEEGRDRGSKPVRIRCHEGPLTFGEPLHVGITCAFLGFDANANTVVLETSMPLGLAGAELERLRVLAEEQAWKLSRIRQLLVSDQDPDQKLAAMAEVLGG